ncbi:hypothetical protein [Antrihabitans cavernicola]|uniref:hypothetical protein n=1 Tax=Antrihabitans cavernicola TaxID=2495913 RepID=UPI001658CFE3|nr:hypothetical protein [Spelaeibacter cavernicola]
MSTSTNGDVDLRDATATARVTLTHNGGLAYDLSAEVSFDLPHTDDADVRSALIDRTVDECPMSGATDIAVKTAASDADD